jgi:AcrR family transcriptional regulator
MSAQIIDLNGGDRMERLRADDYFPEALALLGEQGSQALTIASLCDRLDVTKGSFYHHFGGMPVFVEQLLAYWEQEHSERLITISQAQPDPTLRLGTLAEMAVNLPHTSESAIRAWGRSHPDVAEVVERVDKRRERHCVDAVLALGIDRPRARLLGRIAIDLLVGIQTREVPPDPKRVRQMFEEITKLVYLEADPELARRVSELAGR